MILPGQAMASATLPFVSLASDVNMTPGVEAAILQPWSAKPQVKMSEENRRKVLGSCWHQ